MTYQEKVTFDGKVWYQLEWEDVDFRTFESTNGVKDSKTIEELEDIVMKTFPNSNFKSTFIGKRHEKEVSCTNGSGNKRRKRNSNVSKRS